MTSPYVTDERIVRGMEAQFARRRALLEAGGTRLGWKVGFGAPAALTRFGLDRPLIGFLMQEARVAPGAVVSLRGWTKPAAEPEVAIYIGGDVAAGADANLARAAIAGLGPAIELADVDQPPEDVETILAGNIFQRNVVLGACDRSRAGGRLEGLTARVFRGGRETARASDLEANTGRLLDIVRHVADVLAQFGERLSAGDIIIAGSVVPPIFLGPEDEAIALALDPIGDVSVRFQMS